MTKDEIQTAILNICKVPMHSGDFNIVAFDSLCNKLIELGAEKEREAIEKRVMELDETMATRVYVINKAIRERGQE